jgi:hypothetical protein
MHALKLCKDRLSRIAVVFIAVNHRVCAEIHPPPLFKYRFILKKLRSLAGQVFINFVAGFLTHSASNTAGRINQHTELVCADLQTGSMYL